jgi:O-antigen/teichoic acid export membrane protein
MKRSDFSDFMRSVITLLTGSALAHVVPLLLGPVLTRLFSPADLGTFHLFAAVAANVGVVACARYEFALPMARSADEADVLRVLCLRLIVGSTVLAVFGAWGWWLFGANAWVACLPLAVGLAGLLSLATLWAIRSKRFASLAGARVLQYGGAAFAQVVAGLAGWGVTGLVAAPLIAVAVAIVWLRLPLGWSFKKQGTWRAVAVHYRDFPLLNTPHAFAGALQDSLALILVAYALGPTSAGFWGLGLRYLKAPAGFIGGVVSQSLYPKLAVNGPDHDSKLVVLQVMMVLGLLGACFTALLMWLAPWLFDFLFGPEWHPAGELARALAPYIGFHFVASPLGVVTMAWRAQAWALRLAVIGQFAFAGALAFGLAIGGLNAAGWMVSLIMSGYFGYYFYRLATWPVDNFKQDMTS